MAWQNLREDLAEEFSELVDWLPGKLHNNITHTAALPAADMVRRWREANPERARAIARRYYAKNKESLNQRARDRTAQGQPSPKYRRKLQAKFERGEISEITYKLEMGLYVHQSEETK